MGIKNYLKVKFLQVRKKNMGKLIIEKSFEISFLDHYRKWLNDNEIEVDKPGESTRKHKW